MTSIYPISAPLSLCCNMPAPVVGTKCEYKFVTFLELTSGACINKYLVVGFPHPNGGLLFDSSLARPLGWVRHIIGSPRRPHEVGHAVGSCESAQTVPLMYVRPQTGVKISRRDYRRRCRLKPSARHGKGSGPWSGDHKNPPRNPCG